MDGESTSRVLLVHCVDSLLTCADFINIVLSTPAQESVLFGNCVCHCSGKIATVDTILRTESVLPCNQCSFLVGDFTVM